MEERKEARQKERTKENQRKQESKKGSNKGNNDNKGKTEEISHNQESDKENSSFSILNLPPTGFAGSTGKPILRGVLPTDSKQNPPSQSPGGKIYLEFPFIALCGSHSRLYLFGCVHLKSQSISLVLSSNKGNHLVKIQRTLRKGYLP